MEGPQWLDDEESFDVHLPRHQYSVGVVRLFLETAGRDGVEIKSPNTGPLIDATGTGALAAQIPIPVDPDVAFFPGDLRRLRLLQPSFGIVNRLPSVCGS